MGNELKGRIRFAICSGYIVGVFKPTHWFLTDSNEYVGRWEFEGVEISDSPYLHMDISQLVGKDKIQYHTLICNHHEKRTIT